MELAIRTQTGQSALEVSEAVFAVDYKPGLVHQVVTAYMAARRSGTSAQKNRAAVSGGGAKPWRQKGTGRARAGTSRSPLWRSGGVTFASSTRDYSQKVNRKMYRGAVRSILSELIRQERLILVDDLSVPEAKTREVKALLQRHQVSDVLLLIPACDEKLMLGARNLPNVEVMTAAEVDPVSLLTFDYILATDAAVKRLEERLK